MAPKAHIGEKLFTQRCVVALSRAGFIAKEMAPLTIGIRRAGFSAVQQFRDLYTSYLLEDPSSAEAMIGAVVKDLVRAQQKVTESQEILSPTIVFPMLCTAGGAGDAVCRPAFGDVRIIYAADLPTHWQFIDDAQLTHWGVDADELHNIAVANLKRRTRNIQPTTVPGNLPLKLYAECDGFDAARALILPDLEPDAPAFTFAVPNRNQLLYLPATGLPEAFVGALRAQVELDHETMDHAVSPHLWTLRGGTYEQLV